MQALIEMIAIYKADEIGELFSFKAIYVLRKLIFDGLFKTIDNKKEKT